MPEPEQKPVEQPTEPVIEEPVQAEASQAQPEVSTSDVPDTNAADTGAQPTEPEATTEDPESEAEPSLEGEPEQLPKAERKGKAAKDFRRLTTALSDVKRERDALKAQLLSQMNVAAQPQKQEQPVASAIKRSDEEQQAIAAYHQARNSGSDDGTLAMLQERYEAAKDRRVQNSAIEAAMAVMQQNQQVEKQKQVASVWIDDVLDVNTEFPCITQTEQGGFDYDYNAPIIKLAVGMAAEKGFSPAELRNPLLFTRFLEKAANHLRSAKNQRVTTKLKQAEAKNSSLAAKAGLENARVTGVRPTPNPERAWKEIEARAKQGDVGAQREVTRAKLLSVVS